MKSKNILISALALGTLVIAGCNANTEQTTPTKSNGASTTSNVGLTIVGDSNSTQNSGTQALTNYSSTDTAAYVVAMEKNDAALCSKIADTTYKTECENILNDRKVTTQAVTEKDSSICNQVKIATNKQPCIDQVNATMESDKKVADEKKDLADLQTLSAQIEASGSVSRCNELKDANFMEACEVSILSTAAIANNDKSCDKGSTESIKEQCEQLVAKSKTK